MGGGSAALSLARARAFSISSDEAFGNFFCMASTKCLTPCSSVLATRDRSAAPVCVSSSLMFTIRRTWQARPCGRRNGVNSDFNDMKAAPVVAPQAMLCLLVPALPEGEAWRYEIKWDGYRALAVVEGGKVHLISRNAKPLPFPEVAAAALLLRCKRAVVDGEIIALDAQGQPSFSLLQNHRSKARTLRFMLFDLLELNGTDWRRRPLHERREKLHSLMPAAGEVLGFSRDLEGDADALMRGAKAAGLEGIVAKRRDSRYEPGERSGAWSKWKAELAEVFTVGGHMPGGEIVIGKPAGKGLRYVARLKAGFVPRTKKELLAKLSPLKSESCPFSNLPETGKARWGESMTQEKMDVCQWVKPSVKIRVAFVEWTESKHLRHSRFLSMA